MGEALFFVHISLGISLKNIFIGYYVFGSVMPQRFSGGNDYRYGFQGQEEDGEIKGENNSVNYKYRMHDPRLGRFFSVDPLAAQYPHNSPYAFSENRVIDGVELEGLEYAPTKDKQGNVTDYKWVGYVDGFTTSDGISSENYSDIPGWSVRTDISAAQVAPAGTVSEGQVNYWKHGMQFSQYYGVTSDKQPYSQTYLRAPWMAVIEGQMGLTEDKSSNSNPKIQAMIDQLNADFPRSDGKVPISNDDEPWCGVCAYNALKTAGYPVSSNGWQSPALNTFYKNNWNEGTIIQNPAYGAIAVMTFGHVAFVHSYNKDYVWIIGGNQRADGGASGDGSEVNIRRYKRSMVSKFVLPSSYTKPPLD